MVRRSFLVFPFDELWELRAGLLYRRNEAILTFFPSLNPFSHLCLFLCHSSIPSPRLACKEGLDETLDNTVVSFGKYLFQCVYPSPLFLLKLRY
jgi:hypothetical protein